MQAFLIESNSQEIKGQTLLHKVNDESKLGVLCGELRMKFKLFMLPPFFKL